MKTNTYIYDRKGVKSLPVIKGNNMGELVVGKIESISNRLGDKIIPYDIENNIFLDWLKGYKKGINELLESAIKDNKSERALLYQGKLNVCNDIELAYIKLK